MPARFQEEVRRVPGVSLATCGSHQALGRDRGASIFRLADGRQLNLNVGNIDTGFFEAVGITPVAGRLFDEAHGEDNILRDIAAKANPSIILNESAARALGYTNPADAVGKSRFWSRQSLQNGYGFQEAQESTIVGVVPDFSLGTIRKAVEPTAYFVDPYGSYVLLVKLDGRKLPETLRGIEKAWNVASQGRPMIDGRFLDQMMNDLYADIRRQGQLFGVFSVVAIIVAALGLLGLAVFTAERRTHEIGVRKAMGASRVDILRFITWQFVRPVLIANVIAWPAAWFFMRRWLEGFAYRVDVGVVAFVLASALALGVALLTVTGHAMMVSRARPVEALRYE